MRVRETWLAVDRSFCNIEHKIYISWTSMLTLDYTWVLNRSRCSVDDRGLKIMNGSNKLEMLTREMGGSNKDAEVQTMRDSVNVLK